MDKLFALKGKDYTFATAIERDAVIMILSRVMLKD